MFYKWWLVLIHAHFVLDLLLGTDQNSFILYQWAMAYVEFISKDVMSETEFMVLN